MFNRMTMLTIVATGGILFTACEKEEAVEPRAEAVEEKADAVEEKAEETAPEVAAAAKAETDDAEPAEAAAVGKPAPAFTLTDQAGQTHNLADYKGKIVVLEWTNPSCPYVERHYQAKTMQNTLDKLANEDLVWLAVDSSHTVKPEDSARWKTEEGFSYPVLQDAAGKVGQTYGAKTTPHMFVVDAEGTLRYSGAIDNDPRGEEKEVRNYVEEAVTALTQGTEIEEKETKPYGCSVKYGS